MVIVGEREREMGRGKGFLLVREREFFVREREREF